MMSGSIEYVTDEGIILMAVMVKNDADEDIIMAVVNGKCYDVDKVAVRYGDYIFTTLSCGREIRPTILKVVAV
jgi:hypothetical protein